ncbi:MAG TPA: DUF2079 domain-containing protein, partial [Rubrobacteraceae bacterium]|nr:DUF2079 domain-containing protein [Rubrobacteraceae bacterium]
MKTRSPQPPKVQKAAGARRRLGPRELVICCAVVYAVLISGLSMYKHETYASSRFDLGNMDQAVWNSAHGRILEATDEYGEITSRLKNHTDFLLLAFVPLYWISPSPHWLLVTQAVVVGIGAVPLYWLARRFLGYELPAALLAVAYLFNPGLQSANLFDFHAQMMAGTFLLFAFHYLLERRLLPFLAFATLAALTKEGIVLIVGMMGLYVLLVERRPRWGIPVFLASAGYFLLTMLVIIPFFNTGGASELVEGRYAAFGGSLGGVVRTTLAEPIFTISYVLSQQKALYLTYLTGMTWFFGLFSPTTLVLPLPDLAVNLLSDRPQMVNIRYHYSATIMPFTYVAAAAGLANVLYFFRRAANWRRPFSWLGRLARREVSSERTAVVLTAGMLLFAAQMDYDYGPLPVFHSPGNFASVIKPAPEEHLRALDEAVAMIPDGAKVSASNQIGPHLSYRRYLYLFPDLGDARYVILDETEPGYDTYINPVLNL